MPATVLKRKHSLKGKNIFPLLKRLRDNKGDVPSSFARLAQQQRTEEMSKEECMKSFKVYFNIYTYLHELYAIARATTTMSEQNKSYLP